MDLLSVTLNPAIDVTYRVAALRAGTSIRVSAVDSRPGGKGVNVAAVADALGAVAEALVLTGGSGSEELTGGLDRLGLRWRAVPGLSGMRRTVALVPEQGETTMLLEPGSPVAAPRQVADQVTEAVTAALAEGVGAVVVSGSLAPGLPVQLPARIAGLCHRAGIPCVVDTSGASLAAAIGSGAVLKPNRDELEELLGALPEDPVALAGAAGALLAGGAPACLITLGAAGLLLRTPQAAWLASPPERVSGNPTGAGDAAAAAFALGLAARAAGGPAVAGVAAESVPAGGVPDWEGPDWEGLLADVVATSAAAVLSPLAGGLDLAARERWLPLVEIRELPVEEGKMQ